MNLYLYSLSLPTLHSQLLPFATVRICLDILDTFVDFDVRDPLPSASHAACLVARDGDNNKLPYSFSSSQVFGFHSRARRWASAICSGVIFAATASRRSTLSARIRLSLEAARFTHLCA